MKITVVENGDYAQKGDAIALLTNAKVRASVVERCGTERLIADGIRCTNCGCLETFKPADDPEDVERWAFVISAFKADYYSKCGNCGEWF